MALLAAALGAPEDFEPRRRRSPYGDPPHQKELNSAGMISYRDMMREITSDEVIDRAYAWVCERRRDYSADQDVWDLRRSWEGVRPQLQASLLAGQYRLGAVHRFRRDGEGIEVWPALDALVLKAIAIVLSQRWQLPSSCYHLAGHRGTGAEVTARRGAKAAVRNIVDHLRGNPFVFRTDVKSYYASIDHDVLMGQLHERVDDAQVLDILEQYVRRTVYADGVYTDATRGICLGCPLSPLMGALYLAVLDERMAHTGLFYARFMDDWVVLAPTRWKLRKAIKVVRETLTELKVEIHPDKTFIGRVARGFSFLGYRIKSDGIVGVAVQTLERFSERMTRLYEQGATPERIGKYVRRWLQWVRAGLEGYLPVTLRHAAAAMLPRLLSP